MAYRTATITNASPALALAQEIEAGFGEHANWDFVKDVVIGTYTYRVWKNRGTGSGANAFGQDFFLAFRYLTAAGGADLRVVCFESFDATNNKAIRPCTGYTTNQTPNANGSFGDETAGFTLDASALVYASITVPTTAYQSFVSVSADRVCCGVNYSTTDHAFHAGLFEPLSSLETFPLMICATSGQENSSQSSSGVSRHPGRTAAATYNFAFEMDFWTQIAGNAQSADLFHGGGLASRALLRSTRTSDADKATYGYARGLLKDVIVLPDGSTATRNGDTITISGNVYTKMKFGTSGYPSGAWVRQSVI